MTAFTSHEPSGLIALRAIEELEQERRARERAQAQAREAAAAEARARAEQEARAAEEARVRAEQAAAARTRGDEEARRRAEEQRLAEVAARVRGEQAARLAQIEADLADTLAARRARGRVGWLAAGALGLTGLGLALFFVGFERPLTPTLAMAGEDPGLAAARAELEKIRQELGDFESATEAQREALERAMRERPKPAEPVAVVAPAPRPRPRPVVTGEPKPGGSKRGGFIICNAEDLDDPLAEDCPKKK